MARRVKDQSLDSREARSKLKARGKPYWRTIGRGLHVGYRKGQTGGVWVVRRYIGNQQYAVESFAIADDREDANGQTVLDFWQAQEVARGRRPGVRGPYTVRQAIAAYLEHLGDRPSGYDAKLRLNAFAVPAFGDKAVEQLDAAEIRKWHREMAQTPARKRTRSGHEQAYRGTDFNDPEDVRRRQTSANRCLVYLKAALNLAWREKKVAANDEWSRVQPFHGVETARVRYLTPAECDRLLNACEGEFRTLVHAALLTGARYGELARLRVADFTAADTLHIRKSKTNKDRHVFLTPEGVAFFKQLAAGRNGTDFLLGREWKKANQSDPMRAACKRANIEPAVGFHQLRHTYASLAIMNGAGLFVVAKALGHVDTRMVEKHYGHLAPSYVADAVRKRAPRFNVRAL